MNITFFVLVLIGCIAMMLPLSVSLYRYLSPLRHIQFSWRFLNCATLAQSFLVGFLFDVFWRKKTEDRLVGFRLWFGRIATAGVLAVTAYAISMDVGSVRGAFFANLSRPAIKDIISSRDSHSDLWPVSANGEEAQRLFSDAGSITPDPRFLDGDGQILKCFKTARRWTIQVQAASLCHVVVPQFWFPGWCASGANPAEDFPVSPEKKSGLVQIEVPPGRRVIELRLVSLWPERTGCCLSFGTGVGLAGLTVLLLFRKQDSARQNNLTSNLD